MNAKEFLKKYGVYVLGGAVVLYLVLKNATGGRSGAVAGANQNALELARLASGEKLAAGQLGLEQARIAAMLEAERIRAAANADALQRAADLRNRELSILSAQGAQARLKAILDAITSAAKRATGSTGGGDGRSLPGTPNTFPGSPRLPPRPVEPNLGPSIFNPPFSPSYPEPDLPGFDLPGITFDSGYTFSDQYMGFGSDWDYSVGFGSDLYSSAPELSFGDYPGDIGLEDFTYGYGAGGAVDYGGYRAGDVGAGGDFYYGYGTDE